MSRFLDDNDPDPSEAIEFRLKCRENQFFSPSSGFCPDFIQTNVVFIPPAYSFDFLIFCQRNPKPCPLLEFSQTQSAPILAPNSNLYTDLPKYNIIENGVITSSPTNILSYASMSLHAFLLGCSFSFESALIKAGIPVRHIDENKNVPMYITNIDTRRSGVFQGPLVVTMRPIKAEKVSDAIEITSKFPSVHGAPIHKGDPSKIGIKDLSLVDFGDPVNVYPGEVPVFWACGVTPMLAIMNAKIPFAITHAPGHMFITDRKNQSLDISNLVFKFE